MRIGIAVSVHTSPESMAGPSIDRGDAGHRSQSHCVGCGRYTYVELLLAGDLQQLLELALILSQTALGLHHSILVLGTLCGELSQVGLAHATDFDKFLATCLICLGNLKCGLVDVDGILGIEDLHEELCDLLLDAVGSGGGVKARIFSLGFM